MKSFKTLKSKLVLICSSFMISILTTVSIGSWQMFRSGQELIEIAELKIPLVKILTQATIHQLEVTIEIEKYLRHHDKGLKSKIYDLVKKSKEEIYQAKELIENSLSLAH